MTTDSHTKTTTGDLTLAGWRVCSEWSFPELTPWKGDDRPADITIRCGKIPDMLPDAVHVRPLVQTNRQGWIRYSIRNVATYLVRDGREVIIDTKQPEGTPDVSLFMLGSVFGFLCLQRGLLPLHASCVTFGGRTIAFAGPSGVGKSTMAALLLARGAKLLSDDVTVIDVNAASGPVVRPSFPRQKLWQDTLRALAIPAGTRLRRTVDMEKFDRPVADLFHETPTQLDQIIQLGFRNRGRGVELVPLPGLLAVRALHNNVYRRTAAGLLGLGEDQFGNCALLAQRVSIAALSLPSKLDGLLQAVDQLDALLRTP